MPIDAAILTTLVPGSVWAREESTSLVTVLAVSNQTLSARILERHPEQVVFVTESQQIMTQDVEFFLKKRSFANMNVSVADLMAQVVGATIAEDEEVDDLDEIELPSDLEGDESDEEPQPELVEASDESGAAVNVFPFYLANAKHELAGLLAEQFVSYAEQPWPGNQVLHTLKFSDELALEDLEAVFGSEGQPFTVQVGQQAMEVSSAQFMYAGVEVRGSTSYSCAYLLTGVETEVELVEDEPTQAKTAESVGSGEEQAAAPAVQIVVG